MNQITNFQEIYMKHRIKQIHVTDLFNKENYMIFTKFMKTIMLYHYVNMIIDI